jgi:predicted AAA+ superfamily ATPase
LLIDVYNSIVFKDIVAYNSISNVNLLNNFLEFFIDSTSKLLSPLNIIKEFQKTNRATNVDTLYFFIDAIQNAFFVDKISRYDIKGKQILATINKFYLTDICFRRVLISQGEQKGRKLENIIYNEISIRDFRIFVGKFGDEEIDFVVLTNSGNKFYIQVCYSLSTKEIIDREFKAFKKINNATAKYMIVFNSEEIEYHEDGVTNISAMDFVSNIEKYLY